ncbi:hemin-degrading factor [Celeribacter litoreus]|uniref:hemin-degrading factor n=1 Tax=Celeribacter litoreus TaxID=2876714 RepID=UPI001CCCD5FE|nr:ChuX/HutX family heme-like substrate-binding protein [Celeribacter litoreus]MCA0043964.1 hemin-degrading factor [Celeribacter litoreus]
MNKPLTAAEIRAAKSEATDTRDRDLAAALGISEAELVAAHLGQHNGQTVTRIAAHPDLVMPAMKQLGEVMALTRNRSVVHERVGTFEDYRAGQHASMVLGREIDTRIFPKFWAHGFAIESETDRGTRRTLQFFDHAGDALQKVFLRETSNHARWADVVAELALEDQSEGVEVEARAPVEAAKINEEKRETLIGQWQGMTDTHQFNRIVTRLGMNRLGAYRLAGAPFVRKIEPSAVESWLHSVSDAGQSVVLFVGNRGNIQIHWGPLENIKPMGPWLNVLDPRFNLHLRGDHVAEVYVVNKPTKRGPAISLETFDEDGALIFQCYAERENESDTLDRWHGILDALPSAREASE